MDEFAENLKYIANKYLSFTSRTIFFREKLESANFIESNWAIKTSRNARNLNTTLIYIMFEIPKAHFKIYPFLRNFYNKS